MSDLPYTVTGVHGRQRAGPPGAVAPSASRVGPCTKPTCTGRRRRRPGRPASRAGNHLALIRWAPPLAAVTFPRHVNAATNMQAAAPAYELSHLLHMLSAGGDPRALGVALVGVATLASSWRCGRPCASAVPSLAMLRMLGAGPGKLAGLLCWPRPCGWPRWRVCWAWRWRGWMAGLPLAHAHRRRVWWRPLPGQWNCGRCPLWRLR